MRTTNERCAINDISILLWPPCVADVDIILVHGQVTIIFVVSVGLSVCLFVQSFSQPVFDPISIKLGHMLYVWI